MRIVSSTRWDFSGTRIRTIESSATSSRPLHFTYHGSEVYSLDIPRQFIITIIEYCEIKPLPIRSKCAVLAYDCLWILWLMELVWTAERSEEIRQDI
ncbi:hypothetical protein TNCV_4537161 [Trichonephila clavipes]|nr:hypothetical protein TNCV_4537161 [Trichonephila clavipes]